jgi:F420H(2)-dependent quinone reductase
VTRSVVLSLCLALAGCGGPLGMIPGGTLEGTVESGTVEDWSFTHGVQKIQLETRPGDPYSVNVWCVAQGPNLWVTAGREANTWSKNLEADPRVRVRVGERIFERRAVRVIDPKEVELVLSLYEEKYDYERSPNGVGHPTQFRLDPP